MQVPFGRLRKVVERNSSPAVFVVEYRYSGLNQRIAAHLDTYADGDVDGGDVVGRFVVDGCWRIVGRLGDASSDAAEQFAYGGIMWGLRRRG